MTALEIGNCWILSLAFSGNICKVEINVCIYNKDLRLKIMRYSAKHLQVPVYVIKTKSMLTPLSIATKKLYYKKENELRKM